jgi:hypothetical protein
VGVDEILGVSEDETENPLGYFTDSDRRIVGGVGSSGSRTNSNVIYRYQLPTLDPGETISGFSLKYRITALRDQSDSAYELDTYLLDSANPTTSGTSLFFHGGSDANHALVGSHFEESGTESGSITLSPAVDVTLVVDSGEALDLLQSFYSENTPNQQEVAFRFNLDQDFDVGGLGLNRYILNNDPSLSSLELYTISIPLEYEEWIEGYAVGDLDAPGDDFDRDGISNSIENFFGTNPAEHSSGIDVVVPGTDGFSFTHPRNSTAAPDLSAAYRWSTDLATFHGHGETDARGTSVAFSASTANGLTTVDAVVSGPVPEKMFVAVEVTVN